MPVPSTQPVSTTRPTARPAEHLDVLEAVFRHQLREWYGGPGDDPDYNFLSLGGHTDPPAGLLARFANESPKVLPVSFVKVPAEAGVRYKGGDRGLIVLAISIAWLGRNTAEVYGGYYHSGRAASFRNYRVKRTGGTWRVTDDRLREIA